MGKKVSFYEEDGLKKGPWTAEEDQKLMDYIRKQGHRRWRTVPLNAGLKRCGKSCRLRWTNYLRPDIKRGGFSFEEEETIIHLHSILGNKWSAITAYLPGRTDNEIKNYWNTHIKKRLLRMGIDPVTHAPRLINVQELYSFLINSPHHHQLNIQNLFQIDSEMNTNLLNVVTSLAFPRCKNPQNYQQILQLSNPQLFQNQIETSLQSNNLHYNSTTPLISDTLLMQAEMEQFTPSLITTNNRDNSAYLGQNLVSPQELGHYAGFGSVISTPNSSSSSRLNSSTVYVNGSGHEDEKDTYCSNMMLFDMPYSTASFGF